MVVNAGMGHGTPVGAIMWGEWATLQHLYAAENACLCQVLADHQCAVMEQLVTTKAQVNAKQWKQVAMTLGPTARRSA